MEKSTKQRAYGEYASELLEYFNFSNQSLLWPPATRFKNSNQYDQDNERK